MPSAHRRRLSTATQTTSTGASSCTPSPTTTPSNDTPGPGAAPTPPHPARPCHQDRPARRQIRRLERLINELLDKHQTTLRDETDIGPITAATLLCQVGDSHRFDRESKFARRSGTGAVALSSGEGAGNPIKHRLDFRGNRRINSALYIASVTQQRGQPDAAAYLARKATEGKTRREARRAHKRQLGADIPRRLGG